VEYIKIWCCRFDLEQLNQAIQMSFFCCLIVRLLADRKHPWAKVTDNHLTQQWSWPFGPYGNTVTVDKILVSACIKHKT